MSELLLTYHSPAEPSRTLTFATMALWAWTSLAAICGILLITLSIVEVMSERRDDLAWLLLLPVGTGLLTCAMQIGWSAAEIHLRHLGAAKGALVNVRATERFWFLGYSTLGCLAAAAAIFEAQGVNMILLMLLIPYAMFHAGLELLTRVLHRAAHDPFAPPLPDAPRRGSGEVIGMPNMDFAAKVQGYLRNTGR